jgi:DNA-directed RNA polymerase III subunit RPC3
VCIRLTCPARPQIDAVVRERFGDEACRVFRLLLLKRQLEQKQVADSAMLPVKETRELLYRMFKEEYLELQEVAKTADHAPSRTFFLWRVSARGTLRLATHGALKPVVPRRWI